MFITVIHGCKRCCGNDQLQSSRLTNSKNMRQTEVVREIIREPAAGQVIRQPAVRQVIRQPVVREVIREVRVVQPRVRTVRRIRRPAVRRRIRQQQPMRQTTSGQQQMATTDYEYDY